ncbi:MAG: MscL family protein [bacterium]
MISENLKNKTTFIKEFFEFIRKFGVIGLALGVVIGGAVKTLVDSLVLNIVNPILAKIIGKTDLSYLQWEGIKFGSFLNDIINFVVLLAIVYFTIRFLIGNLLSEDEKTGLKI